MTLGALYVARSRVTARLKEKLQSLTGEWPDLGQSVPE